VLVNTFARLARADDYPAGTPLPVLEHWVANSLHQWEDDPGFEVNAPSALGDDELADAFTRYLRLSTSPGVSAATRRVMHGLDVRDVLPAVRTPTLVVHRAGDRVVGVGNGRYLAEHIPGARLVELPGDDHLFYLGDADAVLDEVEEFLTGARRVPTDRVLATVLFTDIVGSTELTARLGDRRWRELLDQHDRIVRQLVGRYLGELVKTTGDGVLATFDGPGRAVAAANAIGEAVAPLGLAVRAGLHTGEIERRGDDITGLAVVIARRICDGAEAGELRVSRTLTDLVVGSGLHFEPLGTQPLKGVPGEWALFRVDRPAPPETYPARERST
jgi:class 3 adenylate cyclase